MGIRKICFHPLFRVDLVQMFRHGEVSQAIAKAGAELTLALQGSGSGAGSTGSDSGSTDGGIVMVPTPKRSYELGYSKKRPEVSKQKEMRNELGR